MKIIKINAMWCPGCIAMHSVWNDIQKKYPDIEVVGYDYDIDEEAVKKFNPGNILPITIFIIDGKEVDRLNGEKTIKKLLVK